MIVILAAAGVTAGMVTTYQSGPVLGVTAPYSPRFTSWLVPDFGWPLAPHRVDARVRPDVKPAALTVQLNSLDFTSGTALLGVGLRLSDALVGRLRIVAARGRSPVPLTRVPRAEWAQLPVGIQLVNCVLPFISLSRPGCLPNVSLPLGELVGGDGTVASSGTIPVPVSVPVDGSADRFPSDSYEVRMSPVMTLPGSVSLPGLWRFSYGVPVTVSVVEGPGLAQYDVHAFVDSPQNPRVIGVAISRIGWKVITIYVVALLPLLLALVLAHVWVRRRSAANFDLGFAAGLIAALLAILPLRAVLVPGDVAAVSPTIVDDILILGVLLIAGFLFWQYIRFVKATSRRPKDAASPPGDAPRVDHHAPDGG